MTSYLQNKPHSLNKLVYCSRTVPEIEKVNIATVTVFRRTILIFFYRMLSLFAYLCHISVDFSVPYTVCTKESMQTFTFPQVTKLCIDYALRSVWLILIYSWPNCLKI